MQRILILLVLLAAGAGIWFLASDRNPAGSGETPIDESPEPANGNGETPEPGEAGLKGGVENPVGPDAKPEALQLERPSRVLFIGKHQGSWPMLMISVFQHVRALEYRTWFTQDIRTRKGVPGDGRGMTALTALPTGAYLDDNDVEALFLDVVDPNALPKSFWDVVTERVQSGRMGLYLRPSQLISEGGVAVSQHPALSHPALRALLPVARAASIEGSPLPGVFPQGAPLSVTEAGRRHPATRLVANEKASGNTWAAASTGEGAFDTKFCYPVIELAAGAQTLVQAEAATPIPAVVATADVQGRPRVLWMGNNDFGQRTYFVRAKDEIQKTLANHWVVWLVGQAE